MKTKQKYYTLLVVVLFILPILNSISVVAQGADYIGIHENDSYIWDITYDEDMDKDLGDDTGINTTLFDFNDDTKALKHVITWVGEENKFSGDEGVNYKTNKYDSKKPGNVIGQGYNWKLEDSGEEFVILKYDSYDNSVLNHYQMCAMWGVFFTANDVDWAEVVKELNDDLGGSKDWATYSESRIRIHIHEADYDYQEHEYKIKEIDINSEYTNEGVLEYYKFEYDGETIITLQLVNAFWVQYWVFVIIGIIALGAIIVVVLYFTAIRKSKVIEKVPPSAQAPAAKPEEKSPEAAKLEEKNPEGELICLSCGKKNTAVGKFCEYCGKTIEK